MNPFFKNINIFLGQKLHFFYENFRKMEQILQEIMIFLQNYIKIFKFYDTYTSREISSGFYNRVKKTFFEKFQFSGKILRVFGNFQ